ncbi:MAG: hypothetical protein OXL41_13075 [Nitrospinae bacterium]|nr:hypothetical protein [Nitrospinota bacterium]
MSATLLHTVNNTTTDVEHTSMSSSIVAYAPIEQLAEPYEEIPVFVQTHEIDGRYFADLLMEPDLPHHGEGSTPDEATASLFEALKTSWKALHSAKKLSKHMEKRKQRLDNMFNQAFIATW